jgi:hypothetical protein
MKLDHLIILHQQLLLYVLDWLFYSGIGLWRMVVKLFIKNPLLAQLVKNNKTFSK